MKLISEFTENNLEFITEQDKKTGKKNFVGKKLEKHFKKVLILQPMIG